MTLTGLLRSLRKIVVPSLGSTVLFKHPDIYRVKSFLKACYEISLTQLLSLRVQMEGCVETTKAISFTKIHSTKH